MRSKKLGSKAARESVRWAGVALVGLFAACSGSSDGEDDTGPDPDAGGGDTSLPDVPEPDAPAPDVAPDIAPDVPADEICDDGIDNDGDGLTDCEDPDCAAFCDPGPEDLCPDDPLKTEPGVCGCGVSDRDSDRDGVPDCIDECPNDVTKTEAGVCGCGQPETDTDGDGTPDCVDACPDDPEKVEAGVCGCGQPETDTDGDGTPDCQDACPDDPDKVAAGVCGCGFPDVDTDGDGTPDCRDLCPDNPDRTEPGICGCAVPDTDTDGDGVPDCADLCPTEPTKTEPGFCGCDTPDTDTDGDGLPDCLDACPEDPNKTEPGVCGCGRADTDTDGDGVLDCQDGCPADPDKIRPGLCGCGVPDTDSDLDGVPDCADACPDDPTKSQPGLCGCGVFEQDADRDGTPDCVDGCPFDPFKTEPGLCGCGVEDLDTTGDGTADACPSSCDPDLFEGNDAPERAESLAELFAEDAFAVVEAGRADWFVKPLCPGAIYEIEVASTTLGAVTLEVFLADDLSPVDVTATPTDDGTRFVVRNTSVEERSYFFVFSTEEACERYEVRGAVDCRILCDDGFEDNDRLSRRTVIPKEDLDLFPARGGFIGEQPIGQPIPGPEFDPETDPYRGSWSASGLRLADADFYSFPVCALGSASLNFSFALRDAEIDVWFQGESIPVRGGEGFEALIEGFVFDADDEIIVRLAPSRVDLCPDDSYGLWYDLECACGVSYSPFGPPIGFRSSYAVGPLGGSWSAVRTNAEVAQPFVGDLCPGGTLRATLVPRVDDPTLQLRFAAQVEWDGLDPDIVDAETIVFENEEEFARSYTIQVASDASCSAFDLRIEHEGCICEIEDETPNDELDGALPLREFAEGSFVEGYLSGEALQGTSSSWFYADIGCNAWQASVEAYANDGSEVLGVRIYDEFGTLLRETTGLYFVGADLGRVDNGSTGLYIEVFGVDDFVCSEFEVGFFARCLETVCDDGEDNDNDGAVDCDDSDCDDVCTESSCDDGIDNDGNGLTDCDDPQCDEAFICRETGVGVWQLIGRPIELTRLDITFDGIGWAFTTSMIDELLAPDGTPLELSLGDDDTVSVELPFLFDFAGTTWDEVWISSNGRLTFGEGNADYSADPVSFFDGPPSIAPFWTDLNPASSGQIQYLANHSEGAVLQFRGVPLFGSSALVSFDVVLRADGTFSFLYGSTPSATGVIGATHGNIDGPRKPTRPAILIP